MEETLYYSDNEEIKEGEEIVDGIEENILFYFDEINPKNVIRYIWLNRNDKKIVSLTIAFYIDYENKKENDFYRFLQMSKTLLGNNNFIEIVKKIKTYNNFNDDDFNIYNVYTKILEE